MFTNYMFTDTRKRVALILFVCFITVPANGAIAAVTSSPVITTSYGNPYAVYIPSVVAAMLASSTPAVLPSATMTTIAAISPSDYPVRVTIPSVSIDSPILGLGENTKGEMDVPSGKTNSVGWYKYGTVPGLQGSAVFDAHVFAAFKNLKYIAPGSDVYVTMASGLRLHFVVNAAQTYSLSELTSNMLFGLNDTKRLNLITCAGSLTPDRSTYDHRLVVYTTLAGVEQA